VRPIDSLQAQPLAGTEGAAFPFWSPDSRFIGFFADGRLKKIEASGGPPLALCDAATGRGGTWNREGVILLTPTVGSPIHRVSAAGGTTTPVTALDTPKYESSHRWPYFLPDGRHFLYVAGSAFTPKESPTNSVLVGSLDSKESKLLFHTHANAIYASGHILFLRQNTLMAQPFDAKRQELTGEAFPLADPVQEDEVRFLGIFSASENGVFTYVDGANRADRQLIWVDRSGKRLGELPGADAYANAQISPDGKRLMFTLEDPGRDIWVYDVARGVKTRLTFGSSFNSMGLWSPDGRQIAYACVRPGKYGICLRPSDGSSNEEVIGSSLGLLLRAHAAMPFTGARHFPPLRSCSTRKRTASHGFFSRWARNTRTICCSVGNRSPAPTTPAAAVPAAFADSAASSVRHPRSRPCRNAAVNASPAPVESTARTANEGTCRTVPSSTIRHPRFPSFMTTSGIARFRRELNAFSGLR